MRASRDVTRPSPLTSAASSCAPVAAIRSAIAASAGRRGCRQSRDRRVRVRSTVTDTMPDVLEAVPAIWVRGIFSADVISHHFAEFSFKVADILRCHCKLDQIIEQRTVPLSKVAYPLG